jgi:hypothetical protein
LPQPGPQFPAWLRSGSRRQQGLSCSGPPTARRA